MALRRALTLPQLVFYGVGTMIGAGIYSVIGAAAGEAGPALWLSFLLAGIVALLTVLSYAELAAQFPRAGAEYHFINAAFPNLPWLPFLAGLLITLSAAATSATVALAFAGYAAALAPVPQLPIAFALLVVCTIVNIAGIRQAAWIGIALICVETGGLLLFAGTGLSQGEPLRAATVTPPGEAGGLPAAAALIFFVYMGFEDLVGLAEESRRPERDMPRALLVSVGFTTLLYLLIAVALVALDEDGEIAGSAAPLADAAGRVAPWLAVAMSVAALFATASTALISMVSISRMLFGMAREGAMPAPLKRLLPGRKTPWIAALILFAGACALLPLGEVKVVASVSSLSVLLVFVGVQAAMIALRFRKPGAKRPFRVPGAIPVNARGGKLPLAPVLGIAACLALLTQFEPLVYLIGAGVIAAGLVLRRVMPGRPAGGQGYH